VTTLAIRPPAAAGDLLDCRGFGELSVLCADLPADLGGPKQRLLLAVLVCRANSVVRVDELIDALWPARPPQSARKNLQVYVSKLRKVFHDRLSRVNGGYRLRIGPADCDLLRFEHLARSGRQLARAGETDAASGLLDQALSEWRDSPLPEFGAVPCVVATADRLTELHLSTLEDWAELEIDEGRYWSVLDRLEDHVRPHALRERLAAAWMRALAAAGRANEALAHFDFVRRALSDELGVPPSPVLGRLHGRLLREETPAWPGTARGRTGPGNQLPRDLADFVGRTGEVRRAVEHFGGGGRGVLVVSGPVGSGKSAFAVHVAHQLEDAFPDGRLLLEVKGRPSGEVLRDVLDMAGLEGGNSATHALARWRSWVAGKRLLLVLDDVTSEDMVRALAPGAGASAVIVVGRNRLSGVESALRADLPALSGAESAELLGKIIGPSRLLADLGAAQRLLECCEGSPLAVRVVGARLNALRHVRLADFADRLQGSPLLLDEMSAGEIVLRERYESFYSTLSGQQRAAYDRVAALSSPFDHAQAVAALADLPGTAEAALESLFECALLTAPDAEVSAHSLAYAMSPFAHSFARTH
jgi:DNA-binding SARP family transcriptional activator